MKQKQNKMPAWYWIHGLHDARILSVTQMGSDWNPDDTSLLLAIDCDGAMFEANITEIRLHNVKVQPTNFDLNLLSGGWWLWDKLYEKGNGYLLELQFDTAECDTKTVEITFKRADVMRV